MKVSFMNWHCNTQWSHYMSNGALALQLVASDGNEDLIPGQPIATATVNNGHEHGQNQILVKDYFENEGMLEALINAGVIEPESKLVSSVGARIVLCTLTKGAEREVRTLLCPLYAVEPSTRNERPETAS